MARIRANPLGGVTNGTSFDDEIEGSSYVDHIRAGAGDDAISTFRGNDFIEGGAGADKIDGGEGIDTVTFLTAPVSTDGMNRGVSVDLHHGVGMWGDAQGDTYVSVENVTGSRYNDALRGSTGNNVLSGGEGDDHIAGGAGGDRLDGGEGVDTLSYSYYATPAGAAPAQSTGVKINLATNTASGGHAEGDIISNFENVIGTGGKDTLIGNDDDNKLEGLGNNDYLDGGAGEDKIEGGEGDDTMIGGSGDDVLFGHTGNDRMRGGEGADTFIFQISAGTNSGHDVITDFEAGVDQLSWNPYFPQVGYGELNFSQVGADLVITYDDAPGSLTLIGVSVGDLAPGDFY